MTETSQKSADAAIQSTQNSAGMRDGVEAVTAPIPQRKTVPAMGVIDPPEKWPDQMYAQAVRDLAAMDHVSETMAGVLRDCADVIDQRSQLAEERAAKYYELIYQVGNVYPNETRHQTAMRYLRDAETSHRPALASQKANIAP